MKYKTQRRVHHTFELKVLEDFKAKHTVLFARSSDESKELLISLDGNMQVLHGDKLVYEGFDTYSATEAYNSITEAP